MHDQSHDQSHDFSFKNNEEELNEVPILEDTDLYSNLNISATSSQEEIQNAYKKLSRLYHPDKHSMNPDNYQAAQMHFTKIKEAYDILSDLSKRAYYDQYGMKGLAMQNWEIVARTRHPEELQLLYECRQRLAEDERLNRITRPDSVMTLGFDLTDVFDRYLKEESSEHYMHPSINIHKAEVRQSVCLGMTNNDTVNLIGACSVKNGIGKGQLIGTWRRLLYPTFHDTWIDFQTSVTTDSDVSGAVILSRKMWDKITVRLGGSFVMPRYGTIAPGVVSSFNWQITDHIFGEVEYKWNLDSQMYTRLGWQSTNGNHGVNVGIKISGQDTYLTLYYNYILNLGRLRSSRNSQQDPDNDEWTVDEKNEPIKLKIGGRYGVNSFYGEVGITRRITKFSTFGISLSIGVPLGVLAKFKIIRGNQTFVFPLLMSEELDPAASFYGSLVPMAVFFAVKNLLYDPWKRREMDIEMRKRRQNYQSELKRRRDEAYSAQNLMQETARRSCQQERDKNGLVIERAIYGKLATVFQGQPSLQTERSLPTDDHNSDPVTQETIDVTVPLQVLVDRSRLILAPCRPGFTRGQLQGFYDPCLGLISTVVVAGPTSSGGSGGPGTQSGDDASAMNDSHLRQLYVRYRFLNVSHEVVVGDHQPLAIPMEAHQVN